MKIKLRKLKQLGFTVDFDQKRGELSIMAGDWSQETGDKFQEFADAMMFDPPEAESLLYKIDELVCIKGIKNSY